MNQSSKTLRAKVAARAACAVCGMLEHDHPTFELVGHSFIARPDGPHSNAEKAVLKSRFRNDRTRYGDLDMADEDASFPITVSETVPVHAMLDAIERHKAEMGGYLPFSVRTRLVLPEFQSD